MGQTKREMKLSPEQQRVVSVLTGGELVHPLAPALVLERSTSEAFRTLVRAAIDEQALHTQLCPQLEAVRRELANSNL